MARLEVGDTVRLKSGGPVMTVTAQNDDDEVDCTWFWDFKKKVGAFPEGSLDKVDTNKIGTA